jgi:hypothetical protein
MSQSLVISSNQTEFNQIPMEHVREVLQITLENLSLLWYGLSLLVSSSLGVLYLQNTERRE